LLHHCSASHIIFLEDGVSSVEVSNVCILAERGANLDLQKMHADFPHPVTSRSKLQERYASTVFQAGAKPLCVNLDEGTWCGLPLAAACIPFSFLAYPLQRVGSCYGRTRGRPVFVILANRSGAVTPLQGQHGQVPACCALLVNREPEQRLEAELEDRFAMERPVKQRSCFHCW
jgi:hypothetical protein